MLPRCVVVFQTFHCQTDTHAPGPDISAFVCERGVWWVVFSRSSTRRFDGLMSFARAADPNKSDKQLECGHGRKHIHIYESHHVFHILAKKINSV